MRDIVAREGVADLWPEICDPGVVEVEFLSIGRGVMNILFTILTNILCRLLSRIFRR